MSEIIDVMKRSFDLVAKAYSYLAPAMQLLGDRRGDSLVCSREAENTYVCKITVEYENGRVEYITRVILGKEEPPEAGRDVSGAETMHI